MCPAFLSHVFLLLVSLYIQNLVSVFPCTRLLCFLVLYLNFADFPFGQQKRVEELLNFS